MALADLPKQGESPPLVSRLSRPQAVAPLNLQLLYKRKCVLLL